MNYEYLSFDLILTLILAYALTKVKVNPIVAYLIGGVIGTSLLGIDYNSSYFSILTFLALNLLSFEIGAGFNISNIGPLFRKSITIALIELTLITVFSYLAGIYLLHFSALNSTFLVLASLDTSTSILYKLFEKRNIHDRDILIAVASIEDVEVFFLYSLFVALNGSFKLVTVLSVLIEILVASALIYGLARLFLGRFIENVVKIDDQGLTVLIPVTLVFVFQFISESVGVPTTLSMILAGIAFSSVASSAKVFKLSSPIRDLALIFFFLSVGGYLKISLSILEFIVIGILVLAIKYFSFSTASWLTGSRFREAFTNGFYMIAISEFGIIVSIDAIGEGLNVYAIYYLSVVVVLLSSILVSFIDIKMNQIEKRLDMIYTKSYSLRVVDSALLWLNRSAIDGLSPLAKSNLFKSFVLIATYLIVPFFLFPKLNQFVYTLAIPIVAPFVQIISSIADLIVAILIFSAFIIQVSKIYYTLYNTILFNLMYIRASWLREIWKTILSPVYIGQRFYLLTAGLIFWLFDLADSIVASNFYTYLLPLLLVTILGSVFYFSIIRTPYQIDSSFIRKPIPKEKVIKITISSIKKSKKKMFVRRKDKDESRLLEEIVPRL